MSYEPDVLSFSCNWCGYAGADQAGANKIQYPTNVKILRVMCLGRVDTSHVLQAFKNGYDGIMLIGCHIGDCHYVSGNINAFKVVQSLHNIMKILGIEQERLIIREVSSGEGPLFAKVATEFVDKLKELGPTPFSQNKLEKAG